MHAPNARADPLKNHHRYKRVEFLGSGSFGFVEKAVDLLENEHVAIKMLRREGINKYVENETVNHSLLRHPHVIQFREVFLTQEYVCIVMEYASGGNLLNYVKQRGRLTEAMARWFFQQLMIGVEYCHKCGVANRDIKLDNALLHEVAGLPLPILKISDFGYSVADFQAEFAKSKVGTMTYMAPEVIMCSKYDGKAADIWSCGVMLYAMLYGRFPFSQKCDNPAEVVPMLNRMLEMNFPMPDNVVVSSECRSLLLQLLQSDPAKRISLAGIMAHPWFLQQLPAGAAKLNDAFVQQTDLVAAEVTARIKELLQQVPIRPAAVVDEQQVLQGLIDDAIDEEVAQGCSVTPFAGSQHPSIVHDFQQGCIHANVPQAVQPGVIRSC